MIALREDVRDAAPGTEVRDSRLGPSALARPWRFFDEPPRSGIWNMAEDLALLEGDGALPALRLYSWDKPTLSLGYSQDADRVVDFPEAERLCVPVVRRPTGGGSVLHEGTLEVTYSVVADEGDLPSSVVEAYRVLAEPLARALRDLGLAVSFAETIPDPDAFSAVCFETPTRFELLVEGRKAVGSAQCRRAGRVLQHGAIPLHFDPVRAAQVMQTGDKAALAARVSEHATGLNDVSGRTFTQSGVRQALARAFAETFGCDLTPGELTAEEWALRDNLVRLGLPGPIRPGMGTGPHAQGMGHGRVRSRGA